MSSWVRDRQRVDEELFRAWQKGDRDACEEIWARFNARLFTVTVRFCGCLVDESSARQVATTAFSKAWEELDVEGGKSKIAWRGEPQLLSYVQARVLFRCRDDLKRRWTWLRHAVDLTASDDEAEGDDFLGRLAAIPATQDDEIDRPARGRWALRQTAERLAVLGELFRDRPRLVDVIGEMREYFRRCLVEAGRLEDTKSPPRDWDMMSVDGLVEIVNPELVEASRKAMYTHIRARLGLEDKKDRNTFDQRMKDVSDGLRKWLSASDEEGE